MSAISSLQNELRNLIAQSRRRNNDLVVASEKSLAQLQALETGETQNDEAVIVELRNDASFMSPFILACSEANAKSCASALQSIHSLAIFRGISPQRLKDLLAALMDATHLGLGIQLKILQLLPVLLQNYAAELDEHLAVELLQVCAELLGKNKVAMVHNAAYATLQQLITGLFDRILSSDEPPTKSLVIDQAHQYTVSEPVYVAAMVLMDLCDLAENSPARFVKFQGLPLTFTLELLELTLTNQAPVMHRYEEFGAVLRIRVTPLLLRLFNEASEFPVQLRVTRVFYLLLRQHLDLVTTEAEVILSIIAQVATQGPAWKRTLCLEVLQGIFLEIDLVVAIYQRYDGVEDRMNVMQSILNDFAEALANNDGILPLASSSEAKLLSLEFNNLSSEDPQATPPASPSHSQALTRNSVLRIPVIDMLDKVDPPRVPLDYLYYLILKCVSSLADGMHLIARKQGTNPLVVGLVQHLATPLMNCLTLLLGAAMDFQLFQLVVRSVQRVAHAAGILAMYELRDEYSRLLQQFSYLADDLELRQMLLPRTAICTKALFNLGYALGNQFGSSWHIITSVIDQISRQCGHEPTLNEFFGDDESFQQMEGALRKLLDGTQNLNDDAVVELMNALGKSADPINFILIQYIASVNIAQFAQPESPCWGAMVTVLLKYIVDPRPTSSRALASQVLNEVSQAAMESATEQNLDDSDKPEELDEDTIAERKQSHVMIIDAICRQMKAKDYSVQVGAINTLNRLLDKSGARILAGWERIFEVLSGVTEEHANLEHSQDRTSLVRCSFHTLELVCSDFLDNLPYSCMFELTLCLEKFSRQQVDLNTSFSSTSLFWAVCDHLIKDSNNGTDFIGSTNTEDDLVRLARDESSPVKRYALWMLAQIRLADIASVRQQQVRTGAIQIFLRLFDTHGPKLPLGAWSVAHRLAFPTLLKVGLDEVSTIDKSSRTAMAEIDETLCLIVNGLEKIYIANMRKFIKLPGFPKFWSELLDYFNKVVKVSAVVSFAAYSAVGHILNESTSADLANDAVRQFWKEQDPSPAYSSRSPKATSESLLELVRILPATHVKDLDSALSKIALCAKFPYYHSGGTRSLDLSNLQKQCVTQLEQLDFKEPKLLAHYLVVLTDFSLLPYGHNEDDSGMDKTFDSIDEDEAALGPEIYRGLSSWAIDKLESIITQRKEAIKNPKPLETVPKLLTAMLVIMRASDANREVSVSVYLKLLEVLKGKGQSLSTDERHAVAIGCQSILDGPPESESQTITALNQYIGLTDSLDDITVSDWEKILKAVLVHSVLYERHRLTRQFYADSKFDSDDLEDLSYGTVEPPIAVAQSSVSYFCLDLLKRLSLASRPYSDSARRLYEVRARAVLLQYVGDSRILGREPMRTILRNELIHVLKQLDSYKCPDPLVKLVVKCIPNADPEVLELAQSILT